MSAADVSRAIDAAESLVIAMHTAILQDHKNDIEEAERDDDAARSRLYQARASEREHELRTARAALQLLRSAIAREHLDDATAARDIVLETMRDVSGFGADVALHAVATLPWGPFYR